MRVFLSRWHKERTRALFKLSIEPMTPWRYLRTIAIMHYLLASSNKRQARESANRCDAGIVVAQYKVET